MIDHRKEPQMEEQVTKNKASTRVFTVCQFGINPRTGETIADLQAIINNLKSHKSITDWAYCIHDKDVHTQDSIQEMYKNLIQEANNNGITDENEVDDYLRINAWANLGDLIAEHIHIVGRCKSNRSICQIANWLGVPEFLVKKVKGKGAFLDCIEYLTHEDEKQQALGKYHYPDDEIHANFDWRKALTNKVNYGSDVSIKTILRYEIMYNGMTLAEARKEYPVEYMNDLAYLKKCRLEYIHYQTPPTLRLNLYVDGAGGIGKNTCCKALAKCLYPDFEDANCYFEIGGDNVTFDGYDGQPVIIWNDVRAGTLISRFGRSEVFDIFDSHPTSSLHNIKYGSINLVNEVNIINGIQPYNDFLDGLAGEYESHGEIHKAEDKSQSYRRFPIILCLRENDFDILLNKGVATGTREFMQYEAYKYMMGSFQQIATRLSSKAREVVSMNMLSPVMACINKVYDMEGDKISEVDQIPDEFKDYGKQDEKAILLDELSDYIEEWNRDYHALQKEIESIEAEERKGYVQENVGSRSDSTSSPMLSQKNQKKVDFYDLKAKELRRNGYIISTEPSLPYK